MQSRKCLRAPVEYDCELTTTTYLLFGYLFNQENGFLLLSFVGVLKEKAQKEVTMFNVQ